MKKYLLLLAAAILAAGSLSACGAGSRASGTANAQNASDARGAAGSAQAAAADTAKTSDDGRLQIVTTIFPEYDWVMNILGDAAENADVTMLLDNGVDLHSYQPTADDIMKISTCDLFIYVGGESDGWVEDALQEVVNPDIVVIDLLDVLGESVKEEELVEGMQEGEHAHDHGHGDEDHDHDHEAEEHDHKAEAHDHEAEEHDHEAGEHDLEAEEHDHEAEEHEHEAGDHDHEAEEHDHETGEHDHEAEEHDHDHEHDHKHGEVEYDEHVWLSLRNAAILSESISRSIQEIDPEHADAYKSNTAAYTKKLVELDKQYTEAVTGAKYDTLLFGDRFPFRYLVDDYGLSYYAAFVGCSAETEASFETVIFLAEKVDELSLPAVMTIEGNDHRIAETIVGNTKTKDQAILTLDSLQSTTAKDVANGVTYLSVMEKNLAVLKEALN